MPSSSASVAVTPSSSPSTSRRSISRRWSGRVAGPVRREPRGRLGVEPLRGETVDQLRGLAALGEADRPQAAGDELGEEARASPSALARSCSGSSTTGGFQKAIVRAARGAASSSITVGIEAEQRAGQLAGVGDRRRGEQELRLGAVDLRAPAGAAGARCRRGSRRRRGRRGPRPRRRSGGWRGRPPSGRGAGGRRRGACPGWSGSRSPTSGSASAARARCRRRRSRASRGDAELGERAAWSWASAFVG